MQNVVVGFDGSEGATLALDRAAQLGRSGARITVVTATHGHHGLRGPEDERDAEESDPGREALDSARTSLAAQGIAADAVEGDGDPADVIIETAAERKADLIIVGTRGLGTGQRVLLGSVSTKVLHHAPCDVLVVR